MIILMKTGSGFVSRDLLLWRVYHHTSSWILLMLKLLHQNLLLPRLRKITINILLSILKQQVYKIALRSSGLPSTGWRSIPGEWLHAEGVSILMRMVIRKVLPLASDLQYDTVGSQWISEAAKEAVRRTPKFDMLIVAGFNFEGYTADEDMHMGSLTILPIKMSHELMVRELKNTGEGKPVHGVRGTGRGHHRSMKMTPFL